MLSLHDILDALAVILCFAAMILVAAVVLHFQLQYSSIPGVRRAPAHAFAARDDIDPAV
jgi:hypothetical protein